MSPSNFESVTAKKDCFRQPTFFFAQQLSSSLRLHSCIPWCIASYGGCVFCGKSNLPIPPPAKTIPIWAAHTYMAYIWEYPLPRGNEVLLKSFKSIIDWAQNKRQLGRNSKWKINAIVADLHKQKLMYFGHLKRREGLEKIILKGKDRWEKRKRKTEKAVGKEGTYRMFSTRY